jgi:hypothetical protein
MRLNIQVDDRFNICFEAFPNLMQMIENTGKVFFGVVSWKFQE